MAPTSCHYGTPAPIATQPVSTPRFPSPRPSHRKPRSKDIRYDRRSSWKAYLHKFVRLARSEQWTEVEQHDHFCFALEDMESEYYTLLLETDPRDFLGAILKKFEEPLWILCAGPYPPVELSVGESLRQWSDRVLTLATRAFPQLPDLHAQASSRLC